MKVSLNEIKKNFDDLIKQKITREEISFWALQRQIANDEESLEFIPISERDKIWKAIIYLMGVDLKDIDGSYLHSLDNLIEFRKKIKL